ncbi:hypothetical protein L6164_008384 [Bauhinia variegata]|uniref:Uncharacterized protein n=1 Tax=Bauhinia variegata TaxID=167791 RepID=A0ACB9PGI0_BAUVA|nr:hypothetical protein L6164_008384 [Bauhinia variegata]
MDNFVYNKCQHMRKVKKKKVKDELDRLKLAERKKRRLEKALATSAAIISELEKKKEQQRLDEEGAAIAEAVALHVLLGEDMEESCKAVIDEGTCKSWKCNGDLDRRACCPLLSSSLWSIEGMGFISDGYSYCCKWGGSENGEWPFSSVPLGKNVHGLHQEEARWEPTGFSTGLIAAQAVSPLYIK